MNLIACQSTRFVSGCCRLMRQSAIRSRSGLPHPRGQVPVQAPALALLDSADLSVSWMASLSQSDPAVLDAQIAAVIGWQPIWRLARASCRLTAWSCGLIATLHIVAQTSLIRALQPTIGVCRTTMIWPKSWRNLCSAAPRAICHVETVRIARAAHRLGPCAPCNRTQASTALSDR